MPAIASIPETLLSPRRFFAESRPGDRAGSRLLLMLLSATTAALAVLYYSMVDLNWLREQMLAAMVPDRRAAAGALISRSFLLVTGGVSGSLRAPAWIVSLALFYSCVDRVRGSGRTFGDWLGFATSSNVPLLLLLPIGATALMLDPNRRVPITALDTTSIASLLGVAADSPWVGLLASVSVVQLWPVVLQSVGLAAWLRVSRPRAFVLAALPTASYYLIWTLVVLARNW